jgi:galactose oxidase
VNRLRKEAARAAPFTFIVADSAEKGKWGPIFPFPNVAAHTHVLPDGRVLIWGRRDEPSDDLDVHQCTPFVWDPADGTITQTPQPSLADGTTVNLFCSGHTFLADGRLFVVGGHRADSDGLSQASLHDWRTNTWAPTAPMTTPAAEEVRRWYPTATTLPNGDVLVSSGSYIERRSPPRCSGDRPVIQAGSSRGRRHWRSRPRRALVNADMTTPVMSTRS